MTRPLGNAAGDFTRRLGKLSTAVKRGRRDTVSAMALAAKKAQNDRIAGDVGSDMRLSGVGRRGARVGARFDMSGDRATVRATGPLHFVAHPMSPHRVPRVRAGGRRRVVVIPGVGVRAHAMHPGTPGKDTWRAGRRRAQRPVTQEAERRTANIVRRGFS